MATLQLNFMQCLGKACKAMLAHLYLQKVLDQHISFAPPIGRVLNGLQAANVRTSRCVMLPESYTSFILSKTPLYMELHRTVCSCRKGTTRNGMNGERMLLSLQVLHHIPV